MTLYTRIYRLARIFPAQAGIVPSSFVPFVRGCAFNIDFLISGEYFDRVWIPGPRGRHPFDPCRNALRNPALAENKNLVGGEEKRTIM